MNKKFEVVYAEFIEAEDFFDAVDKAKKEGREVLSVLNCFRNFYL